MNGPDTQPIWAYLKEHADPPVNDIDWVSDSRGDINFRNVQSLGIMKTDKRCRTFPSSW